MIEQTKADLRARAFKARQAAHQNAHELEPLATRFLLEEIGAPGGLTIAGYMPIRTEISPLDTMVQLIARGAQLCVPVIRGKDQPLDFRIWTPEGKMVEGPFGARVPANGALVVPDVLIVPLVGFDAELNRLGYGGGFYDRSLELLRADRSVRAIGFAFAAQLLDAVPTEPTDQVLDALVTEQGVIRLLDQPRPNDARPNDEGS